MVRFHNRLADGGDPFEKVEGGGFVRTVEGLDEHDAVVGLVTSGVESLNT